MFVLTCYRQFSSRAKDEVPPSFSSHSEKDCYKNLSAVERVSWGEWVQMRKQDHISAPWCVSLMFISTWLSLLLFSFSHTSSTALMLMSVCWSVHYFSPHENRKSLYKHQSIYPINDATTTMKHLLIVSWFGPSGSPSLITQSILNYSSKLWRKLSEHVSVNWISGESGPCSTTMTQTSQVCFLCSK